MAEELSKKVVIVLVLLAMAVSIIGTVIVTTTYNGAQDETNAPNYGNGAVVQLNVPPSTRGIIQLTVPEPIEGS